MSIKDIPTEIWVAIAGAVSAFVGWLTRGRHGRRHQKIKQKLEGDDLMMEKMEQLKEKLVELLEEGVESAQREGEARMIIAQLRASCPDCVEKILKVFNYDDKS